MLKRLLMVFTLFSLLALFLTAQNFMPPLKRMKNIVSFIWYNFEDVEKEGTFQIKTSKFGVSNETKLSYYDKVPEGLGDDVGESTKSLGFKAAFERKGYNWIDIIPEEGKEKGPFKGIVKNLDMWVWGGNFNYNLEVYLKDFNEYYYPLKMGNIKFWGWRNLGVEIPSSIPQEIAYAPRDKGLTFTKFRLWAHPGERRDEFFCAFDYFKIVTDTYRNQYDGSDLEKIFANEKKEQNPVYADDANQSSTGTQ